MNPIAPEVLDHVHDWLNDRPRIAKAVAWAAVTSPITAPLIAWAIHLGVTL